MQRVSFGIVAAICVMFLTAGIAFAEKGGKGRGSAVSKAVHQAQSEGLKGKELAAKAHEAIDARKEAKEEEKGEAASEEKAGKEKREKAHKTHKGHMAHGKGASKGKK